LQGEKTALTDSRTEKINFTPGMDDC